MRKLVLLVLLALTVVVEGEDWPEIRGKGCEARC